MKFTTPCFIRRNTPELRQKLEALGYKHNGCTFLVSHGNNIYVYSNLTGDERFDEPHYVTGDALDLVGYYKFIDCGDHIELFLALAALREDSDYMQWWCCANENEPEFILITNDEDRAYVYSAVEHWRATPAELIEYFTKNNE